MTSPGGWSERIGRRVKLRDLHILLSVAQTGSMGKAASGLAVSQPVVSKAIADLEHALKVRLLDRSPRGVELTLYGREVLKCGTAVFDELRKGVEALEFLSDPGCGELRVGCTEPLAAGFVGTIVSRLTRQFPRASFKLITADPFGLRDRELQQRSVDLVVTPTESMASSQDVHVEVLFDDRQVIMAGANSKWARRRSLRLGDLMKERWFAPPPDSPIGGYIADCFRAAGFELPRARVTSFSVPLCFRMVEQEGFLAMLPISMLAEDTPWRLRTLHVEAPHVPRPTGILTLRNRTLTPLAEEFIAAARMSAKPLAKTGRYPSSFFSSSRNAGAISSRSSA
jgi:DNA-binding transcriptional LysR family regulator